MIKRIAVDHATGLWITIGQINETVQVHSIAWELHVS